MSGDTNQSQITTIPELFKTMEYGPVSDNFGLAKTWLRNKKFGPYINGTSEVLNQTSDIKYYQVQDPSSGDTIATVVVPKPEDVNTVLNSSKTAQIAWIKLNSHERAKHMYSIARHLQKHMSLLIQMESLNRGVQSKDPRNFDVPAAIRHFYYYAGWAQLDSGDASYSKNVVVGITSCVSSLVALAWIVAPALAAGSTVVLKPPRKVPLTAYLLAQICSEAGLPPGVLNVIPGCAEIGKLLTRGDVSNVVFCGMTSVGRLIRQDTAGLRKSLTLSLNGKTPMLVFDSADLDSAVEGVMDYAWFNQGQVSWSIRTLLVQESVFDVFVDKLKVRMENVRLGTAFDKLADIGQPIKSEVVTKIDDALAAVRRNGGEVFQVPVPAGYSDAFFRPTIVVGSEVEQNRVVSEDGILPIVSVIPFRTAKEAIGLANNSRYGLAASVWTECTGLALEVAHQLQVGTVWINCHGIMDASIPFEGWKQSGFGCFGGREGLLEYFLPKHMSACTETDELDLQQFEASQDVKNITVPGSTPTDSTASAEVDCTYKLYYGGAHKRPDGNSSVCVGNFKRMVAEGSKKDIRNAVEAAVAGQLAWKKLGAHGRAQIIYNIAEKLQAHKLNFNRRLQSIASGFEKEVDNCLQLLFQWAACCDKKFISSENSVPVNNMSVITTREPLGVVGIIIDDDSALESLVEFVSAAICYGNSVVVIPNMKYPTPAMALCQVFDTSDVPKGVINIITGNKYILSSALVHHQDVRAVWYSGNDSKLMKYLESVSSHNMKRTWVFTKDDAKNDLRETLEYNATQCKAIWIACGEIFAN